MKILIKSLVTQDHIESLIRSGLKVIGTWLVSNGMLTAGGQAQWMAGGGVLLTGFVMSFIDKWEKNKTAVVVPAPAPLTGPSPLKN